MIISYESIESKHVELSENGTAPLTELYRFRSIDPTSIQGCQGSRSLGFRPIRNPELV
jgi:hypothetical protein